MFNLLKIHKELKLFVLKALLGKPFQTFVIPLRIHLRKIRFQNTILYLFKPLQAHLQRK
jgi:hypothetical protein